MGTVGITHDVHRMIYAEIRTRSKMYKITLTYHVVILTMYETFLNVDYMFHRVLPRKGTIWRCM